MEKFEIPTVTFSYLKLRRGRYKVQKESEIFYKLEISSNLIANQYRKQ